jgi:hypothetical protein
LKLRRVEDCIRRALDQTEGNCDLAGQLYVKRQLEMADDATTDAMVKLLSISEVIDDRPDTSIVIAELGRPARLP